MVDRSGRLQIGVEEVLHHKDTVAKLAFDFHFFVEGEDVVLPECDIIERVDQYSDRSALVER